MDADDLDLLEACRRGASGARERFARRFAGLVHWSIRKTLGENPASGVDTADVFQEVFRKLFEPGALEGLRDPNAFRGWLVVLSTRTALDHCRAAVLRRGREESLETVSAGPEGDSFVVLQTDPLQTALDEETRRLVGEALDAVGPRERACVRFHYFDGLPHRRIAEILGLSESAVETIIRRCRERLRTALERRGYGK